MKAVALLASLVLVPSVGWAQTPAGEQIFASRCASCHNGQPDARAPAPDALKGRTAQAVIEALVNGAMRAQGSQLSGPDRRAVAEYVTGKKIDEDVTGAAMGRCPVADQFRNATAPRPQWSGWSPTFTNTRFQAGDQAGLTAGDVSKLTLKWAFGFPDASSAWAQPTVFNGRVFVGSQNGTVYSLSAASGCIYWTFTANGGVRTAISVGRIANRIVVGILTAAFVVGLAILLSVYRPPGFRQWAGIAFALGIAGVLLPGLYLSWQVFRSERSRRR